MLPWREHRAPTPTTAQGAVLSAPKRDAAAGHIDLNRILVASRDRIGKGHIAGF
jgi:hypothetical protein